ncbi:SGNH hydrolase-type esterase domain-containing protein [Mycena metata]|uniref:SGNH hydrolase-type esterase domain-containing protein n=1 Tax=Mycena metata TaxID=1033252 RepID=A0AAD7NKW6_9AGAR|nr:SGNH hydrolase-type esterase domain-containing protein [Mycena metata]
MYVLIYLLIYFIDDIFSCVVQNPFFSQVGCGHYAPHTKFKISFLQCVPTTGTTVPPTSSVPSTTTVSSTIRSTTTISKTTSSPVTTSTATTSLNIRLLPLGDSITYGFTSSDGNGYRSVLHDMLQPNNTLNFIGSIQSGTMVDNDNEGHIGAIISQIAGFATNPLALPARPNVVLLMAGTNDILDNIQSGAPALISSLMDTIFSSCPDAALIVATLTPLTTTTTIQPSVDAFNANLTQIVNTRREAGQHILLASMASILASDLIDGIHPTDAGYVKMANAWFPVVEQAVKNGWIGTPVTV